MLRHDLQEVLLAIINLTIHISHGVNFCFWVVSNHDGRDIRFNTPNLRSVIECRPIQTEW